jgi:transglutaminase-like putative cysteine protease
MVFYTAESSVWAIEGLVVVQTGAAQQAAELTAEQQQRSEALAAALAAGPGFDGDAVAHAREVIQRLRLRVDQLEASRGASLEAAPAPADDAPAYPLLTPAFKEMESAYAAFQKQLVNARARALKGQKADLSAFASARERVNQSLDRYLELLNQRQDYLSYYNVPQKVWERSWENLNAAQQRVEAMRADLQKAEEAVALGPKAIIGEAEPLLRTLAEKNSSEAEAVSQHLHRVMPRKKALLSKATEKAAESEEKAVEAIRAMSAPTVEDTTPTIDVRITAEMQSLANSLGNDPLAIFNWVRNTIQFVPYYGSLKGSELTLLDKAGNDLDTSSLLIALLRAAGIPARYVVGTVTLDYERYRNLVGVETQDAVSAVVGTLARPGSVLLLNQDGTASDVRFGHVWVAAYLPANYRGTGGGPGSTWIQMDASVKPVARTAAARVTEYTNIDPAALATQLSSAGVYDATTNQLISYNPATVDNYARELAADVDAFYAAQGVAGDFFDQNALLYGGESIAQRQYPVFPISLPFQVDQIEATYSDLPNSLRYQVTFNFHKDGDLSDPFGVEDQDVTRTYAAVELAAKRTTVTFIPQSGADAQAMYAVNQPAPTTTLPGGSQVEISRLALIPADAVELLPMLRIDGKAQMLGPIQTMGEENELRIQITGPQGTYSESAKFDLQAGGYHAIGFDFGGTAAELSNRLVQGIIDRLELFDQTVALQMQGTRLTKDQEIPYDDLIGAALHVAALNFFVEHNFKQKQWGNVNHVMIVRNPSVGVVSQNMKVEETVDFLGRITREILGTQSDLQVDVPLEMATYISRNRLERDLVADPIEGGTPLLPGQVMNAQNSTREEFLTAVAAAISGSQTEHRIMERQTENTSFSAMKLLNDAITRGEPVTMLSKAQLATEAGRQLNSAEIAAAIRTKLAGLFGQVNASMESGIINQVNAGNIVFAPSAGKNVAASDDPNFVHYEGAAYIWLNPANGAGGYIVATGADGSATLCGSETSDVAELVACAKSQLGSIAPACCCSNLGDLGSGNSIQDNIIVDACAGCAGNVITAYIDVSGLIGEAVTCLVASIVGPALEVMTSQMDDILATYPNEGRGVQPSDELKRMADTISVMMISLFGLFSNATTQLLDSLGVSLPLTPGGGAIVGGYVALMLAHTFTIDLLLENPDF